MDKKAILDNVKTKLTDDIVHNREILSQTIFDLQNSEDNENKDEVLQELVQMLNEYIDDDARKELVEKISKTSTQFVDNLKKTEQLINDKKYAEAHPILDKLLEDAKPFIAMPSDGKFRYFDLSSPIEFALYKHLKTINEEPLPYPIPISDAYFLKAVALNDEGKHQEAANILIEAIKFTPLNFNIIFEYSETLKKLGMLDLFKEVTETVMSFAHLGWQVCQCFRNLAYYYEANQKWDIATALLSISFQYQRTEENKKRVEKEFEFISQQAGQKYEFMEFEPTMQKLDEYKVPLCPSESVVEAYKKSLEEFKNSKDYYLYLVLLEGKYSILPEQSDIDEHNRVAPLYEEEQRRLRETALKNKA